MKPLVPLLLALAASLAPAQVLSPNDEAFLRKQAELLVESARLGPGETKAKWHNSTGFTLRAPGGNMGYPAFWVRDAVMMLGDDLIPASEVEGWIRLISSTIQGPTPWHLRNQVVVPAFSVPDHINFNGRPTFFPGNYETDATQGGKPFGNSPPIDDQFYFIGAVYDHWRQTRRTDLFRSAMKTSFGGMRLSELCARVYDSAPSDPETGLVISGDVETANAKDFGFCDAVFKSGKLLFPSILKWIAARQLAEVFSSMGDTAAAGKYTSDADRIRKAIPVTFFHPDTNHREGWLHSATGVGNQPDVWGSAFAVWSGILDGPEGAAVSRTLAAAYQSGSAVRQGCVRHIPFAATGAQRGWEMALSPVGEYQNGGLWGTAAGWYIAAIWKMDRSAARQMARDYVAFLRGNLRQDGIAQAWEWFNPENNKYVNPLYVATAGLPYISLRQDGLLLHAK